MGAVLANTPDVTTFAANIVVFFAAVTAAVTGAIVTVKKISKSWVDTIKDEDSPKQTSVVSATIMETQTMMMLSESNRNLCHQIGELKEVIVELRHQLELNRISRAP